MNKMVIIENIPSIMKFIPQFIGKKSHFMEKFHTIEFFSFENDLIEWGINSIIWGNKLYNRG